MKYNGTFEVISGFIPQNGGTFPLMRDKDIFITVSDETKDVRLSDIVAGLDGTSIAQYITERFTSEGVANNEKFININDKLAILENRTKTGGTLEQKISSSVAGEATLRANQDQVLQTNINNEQTARINADRALTESISTEVQARKNAIEAQTATFNAGLENLGNKIEGIKKNTDRFFTIGDTDFIEITIDSEAKIIEGIFKDGMKYLPSGVDIKCAKIVPATTSEFLYVILDAKGRVLAGIREDASIFCAGNIWSPNIVELTALIRSNRTDVESLVATLEGKVDSNKTKTDNAINTAKQTVLDTMAEEIATLNAAIAAEVQARKNQMTEHENVQNAKIARLDGIVAVSKDITDRFTKISDDRYLSLTMDSESKLLEAIESDGTKYLPAGVHVANTTVKPVFNTDGLLGVITDVNGYVLQAFNVDGSVTFGADVIAPNIAALAKKEFADAEAIEALTQTVASNKSAIESTVSTNKKAAEDALTDAVRVLNDAISAEEIDRKEQMIEHENTQNLKIAKLDGTVAVSKTITDKFFFISDDRFLDVKMDSESKLLEATLVDGTKYLPAGIELDAARVVADNNGEFMSVVIDKDGRVIYGVEKNGQVKFAADIVAPNLTKLATSVHDIKESTDATIAANKKAIETTVEANKKAAEDALAAAVDTLNLTIDANKTATDATMAANKKAAEDALEDEHDATDARFGIAELRLDNIEKKTAHIQTSKYIKDALHMVLDAKDRIIEYTDMSAGKHVFHSFSLHSGHKDNDETRSFYANFGNGYLTAVTDKNDRLISFLDNKAMQHFMGGIALNVADDEKVATKQFMMPETSFLSVVTDANDSILSFVDKAGVQHFMKEIDINHPTDIKKSIKVSMRDTEYLEATVDVNNNLLEYIDHTGIRTVVHGFAIESTNDRSKAKLSIRDTGYLHAITDSNDRILEATLENGRKYIPAGIKMNNAEFYGRDSEMLGYLHAIVDRDNRILMGIHPDGAVNFGNAVYAPNIKAIKEAFEKHESDTSDYGSRIKALEDSLAALASG